MTGRRSFQVRAAVLTAAALVASGSIAVAPHVGAATVPGPTVSTARTIGTGEGFDVCDAPATSQMRAWRALPFRTVNIYFAGSQRHCSAQPELTRDWVTTVLANGWHIIPTVVDLQAPCYGSTSKKKMSRVPSTARSQGAAAANDAIDGAPTSLTALGFHSGAIAYIDIEHYTVPSGNTTCVPAVRSFLAGWTATMHARGYRSGVYSTPTSGIRALVGKRGDSSYPQPDAIWFARYDGVDSLTSADIPSDYLPKHRIHQYRNVDVQYLGYPKANIDNDRVGGDVMSARSVTLPAAVSLVPGSTYYPYAASTSVATSETLKERLAPTTSASRPGTNKTYANGEEVDIVCQAAGVPGDTGGVVHGDYVWDKLVDGNFVSDLYTNTTGGNGFSSALPRCDTEGPTATVTPLPTATLRQAVPFTYSATDPTGGVTGDTSGIASYDVRWRSATDRSRFGSWHAPAAWTGVSSRTQTLTLGAGTTVCVESRATDRSGNVGRWSAQSCVARALDDRALAAGKLWHRSTGSAYYLGTITRTNVVQARATRSSEQLDRVGIVATRCPTCGKVRVLVDGVKIGDVDLTASRLLRRRLMLLPPFSLRTGTVTVRVLSSGRSVQLDGLVVTRV